MLSVKQATIKDKIKDTFNGDQFNIVYLSGSTGSGKTYLVEDYLEEINNYEDWKGYYIEGKSGDVSAYSTIIQAESVHSPKTEITGKSLNLGFSVFKIFSIGLSSTSRRKEIFDTKIDFFIKMLRKSTESNILIIADSFEFWDESSKTLIKAIINHKKILDHKKVKLLIITNEDDSSKVLNLNARTLLNSVKNLKLLLPISDEIEEIVKLLGYNLALTKDQIETIMSLSGANIDFIRIVIEALYTDGILKINKEAAVDLNSILQHRLKIFGSREADAQNVLKASSIIDGEFNTNEIRYLCNENNDVDDLLYESYTHLFLKKGLKFTFSNSIIRDFFYKKVTGTQARFHLQYTKYLKKNKPENYFSRALHLSLADEEGQETKEVFGLFALAYCRNMEISANEEHQIQIKETLNYYITNNTRSNYLKTDFDHLSKACDYYLSQNYKESYQKLNQISTAHSLLFRSEVLRMKLLVSLMLDLDTARIERDTEALCLVLDDIGQEEAEHWAQCNFALFSTYTNKLGQFNRGKNIADKLQNFIGKQNNRPFFEYLGRVLDRKSFLFNSAEVSIGPMSDSVAYFKETDDYLQYYFALCNLGGILIVLNQFEKASSHLEGCLRLIEEHNYIKFPSTEKIYNNLFLANFLSIFRSKETISEQFFEESIMNFREKIQNTPTEKDAVMLINLANLYLINRNYQEYDATVHTLKNKILVNSIDSFYDYHLINLELAKNILQYDWSDAEKSLDKFKDNIPNFHTKNEKKIKNRLAALSKLIKNKLILEPAELDQWVYDNSNPRDESSSFHCRLFLFSDLQFSSL
ncbi:ATP-binding protein [Paenibacillus xylanexedens]|uniref:ATP-binding protein n=1 Tax=Paenibacillus xylanexedens TaxID=528191 RepID=UPI003B018CF0